MKQVIFDGQMMRRKNNGFTLVEILAAAVIAAFVALAAVGMMKAVSSSTEKMDAFIEADDCVRAASRMLYNDLINIYRDSDKRYMRFALEREKGRSVLSFYTAQKAKVRQIEPEGDVYEVEYALVEREDGRNLLRRIRPNPDNDIDTRGVLGYVGENVDIFEVRIFSQGQWLDTWSEEEKDLPELVEVMLGTRQGTTNVAATDSFVVKLPAISREGKLEAMNDENETVDKE